MTGAGPRRRSSLDLTRPQTVRAVARRFGVRAQAALGQHFLVDPAARDRIVAAVGAGPGTVVLEVGPGLGTLTQALLGAGAAVVAVEIDPACVAALRLTLHRRPGVRVVLADILRCDPAGLGLGPAYRVCGSLPYSLTGVLLPRLLAADPPPERIAVVVQREVARRLAAPAGRWSLATLAVRLLGTVRWEGDLPPEAFWPRPDVHSSLVVLEPRPAAPAAERARALGLARLAFQGRRKQLAVGLAPALALTPGAVRAWLAGLGIEPTRRPGTLTLEEWLRLGGGTPPGHRESGDPLL